MHRNGSCILCYNMSYGVGESLQPKSGSAAGSSPRDRVNRKYKRQVSAQMPSISGSTCPPESPVGVAVEFSLMDAGLGVGSTVKY